MLLSLVKVLDVWLKDGGENLILRVEFINGQPLAEQSITFYNKSYTTLEFKIQKVATAPPGNFGELVVETRAPNWFLAEIRQSIKMGNDKAICSIAPQDFLCLAIEQKLNYFDALANLIGKGRVAGFIRSTIRPAVLFAPRTKQGAPGSTKFGGRPLAPKGFVFPVPKDKPIVFICQIHLGAMNQQFIATRQLRGEGILYFFGTVDDVRYNGEYLVIEDILVSYSVQTHDLVPADLPEESGKYGEFEEKELLATEDVSLPAEETCLWRGEKMSTEEDNSYRLISEFFPGSFDNVSGSQYTGFGDFMLLGHPNQIQNCVQTEAELKDLELGLYNPRGYQPENFEEDWRRASAGAPEWRLLFEVSPQNDCFGKLSNFGGVFNEHFEGTYFVMIRQADLDAMNFSATQTIFQCT